MDRLYSNTILLVLLMLQFSIKAQEQKAQNPILFADVPDVSMIRVDDIYYMSSTTMHLSPGVPIMKSEDLVNWKLVNYAYDRLGEVDAMNLENGESTYGRGSWASCLRYHNNKFYVFTFAATTGKTYAYSTKDIENGPWKETSFEPSYHDLTVHFDDDGKVYMIWGAGKLMIAELEKDLSGVKKGTERVLIENASAPAGNNIMLGAEGSQLFKIESKYYLFNITWPRGGMRTVLIHRAENINGPWEGRLAFQDKGVAQGGLIDTPDGKWLSYLFRDYGSVGRIPYLVLVKWEDGWPILGDDGKVPDTLDLPPSDGLIPNIVASDEFKRLWKDPELPLVWQWNHNPVDSLWSLSDRKGYLRLTAGRTDQSLVETRNTLTQRTIGPVCQGITSIDVSNMKDGDNAGLALLQKNYGWVGINRENGKNKIVMVLGNDEGEKMVEELPLDQKKLYLKASCDFTNKKDMAWFYYSLDNKNWKRIGSELKMSYTLPHFMGYRFGLFNYATTEPGGFVDFDYFRIKNELE